MADSRIGLERPPASARARRLPADPGRTADLPVPTAPGLAADLPLPTAPGLTADLPVPTSPGLTADLPLPSAPGLPADLPVAAHLRGGHRRHGPAGRWPGWWAPWGRAGTDGLPTLQVEVAAGSGSVMAPGAPCADGCARHATGLAYRNRRDRLGLPRSLLGAALLAAGVAGAAPDDAVDPTVSGHSVRVIRAALLGPPDPQAEQRAREFDERLLRTGQLGTLAVRTVEGAALERAQAIVARLAAAQPRRREPPWTVRVLASDPPRDSAFTAGGGFIYVHAGLLERAESEDELAFVFAHEMAHTGLQHDRRQDADGLNRRLEAATEAAPGDEARPRLARVRQALLAAYSRADEQEADAVGAWLARRAGYDPGKAVSYFERQLGQGPTAGGSPGGPPVASLGASPSPVTTGTGARIGSAALPVAGSSGALAGAQPGAPAGAQPGAGKAQRWARLNARAAETHPDDLQRMQALQAVDDHLDGRRTLDSLASIGQGYRVLRVLQALVRPGR